MALNNYQDADFTPDITPSDVQPNMGTYNSPQTFRFWCQKVLPLVYDNSLSYYELLCKVVDYLNKTMEDVNTAVEDVENLNSAFGSLENHVNASETALLQAYTDLQSYVNNYFNNLDVQQEINNKLDVMAEDGTLDTILLPYFNAYTATINTAINNQNDKIGVLEGRMDAFSSLPDGSLSTAADAELVDIRVGANGTTYATAGNAVRGQYNELKSAINNVTKLNLLNKTVSGTRLVREYVSIPAGKYVLRCDGITTSGTDSTVSSIIFYDSDVNVVSWLKLNRNTKIDTTVTLDSAVAEIDFLAEEGAGTSSGDTFEYLNVYIAPTITDETLTLSCVPAESKAVGEAIYSLKNQLLSNGTVYSIDKSIFSIGGGVNVSTGANLNSHAELGRTTLIEFGQDIGAFCTSDEYEFLLFAYSDNSTNYGTHGTGYRTQYAGLTCGENDLYFRIGFRRVDGANLIADSEGVEGDITKFFNSLIILYSTDNYFKSRGKNADAYTVGEMEKSIFYNVDNSTLESGYYVNGNLTTASETNLEMYTPNYSGVKAIHFQIETPTKGYQFVRLTCYASDGTFLEQIDKTISNAYGINRYIEVPETADIVNICFRTYGVDNPKIQILYDNKSGYDDVENSVENINSIYPFFSTERVYAHTFIRDISEQDANSVIIPSESIHDITVCRRLGFKIIEANLSVTSDGKYVVIHGDSDAWGYEVTDAEGNNINDVLINAHTMAWVKENVRYRSKYAKYRTAPLEFEEWLVACKINHMIPLFRYRSADNLETADNIMGKNNYIVYNATRSQTDACIMSYHGSDLTTVSDVKNAFASWKPPLMISLGNISTFSDEDIIEIRDWCHSKGFLFGFAGPYVSGLRIKLYQALALDFFASDNFIPDFNHGNLVNVTSDAGFTGFTTNGTVTDTGIELEDGEYVEYKGIQNAPFLSAANLYFIAEGDTLNCNMYAKYLPTFGTRELSDVVPVNVCTLYVEQTPSFRLTCNGTRTKIKYLEFRASEF